MYPKLKIIKSISLLAVLVSPFTQATSTGQRVINAVGCHLHDTTCYVIVDKLVGDTQCSSTSIRWKSDDANGKETLSLLMAASVAKKKVTFNLDGSCMGVYPKFNYINVHTDS